MTDVKTPERVWRRFAILFLAVFGGGIGLVYAALRFFTGLLGMLFLHGVLGSHFGGSDFNLGWSPFGAMWLASLWPMAFFSLTVSVGCTAGTPPPATEMLPSADSRTLTATPGDRPA